MRTTILITAGLLLATSVQAKFYPDVRGPRTTPAYKLIGINHTDSRGTPFVAAKQLIPSRDDVILGEQIETGNTWYDYQANGCLGKMIAVDNQGGVHTTWMDGYTSENSGTRQQKYNYLSNDAWLEEDGVPAPPGTRSGYGNIVLTNEEEQRAVIFCHAAGILQGTDPTTLVLVDFATGWGAFENFLAPNYPELRVAWPIGVISPEGIIHIAYNRNDAGMISYTTAEFANGQPSFPEVPIEVSPTSLNTYNIAQSPHSERAAMTWISARTAIPAPPEWDGFLAYQMNNDLWLAWTDDGVEWNFDNPLNVTNVIGTNPNVEGDESYGDTLRPFTTHDIIFDENDNIHIVFEARGMWEKAIYDPDADRPPVDGMTLDASFLFHWTEEDCTFSPVADGWYTHQVRDDSGAVVLWPQPGAWKSNVCNPSLSYGPDGDLYCVFNYYPVNDYNDYVDNAGRCNGDVAVTVSSDNGNSWYYPTMLVQTSSPLPEPGEGMCEEYPTIADKVDENLHVLYILDHEAGSVVQDENANNTLNPVYYLKVPTEEVRRDSIWEGPNFHVGVNAVNESEAPTPSEFRLAGAYPNPFNSTTRIDFEVEVSQNIELAVYSTTGQKIADLYSGKSLSGHHEVAFNAIDFPAGIYIVRLSNGVLTSSMKIALVK